MGTALRAAPAAGESTAQGRAGQGRGQGRGVHGEEKEEENVGRVTWCKQQPAVASSLAPAADLPGRRAEPCFPPAGPSLLPCLLLSRLREYDELPKVHSKWGRECGWRPQANE